jgi:hypothetical protein
MRNRPIWPIIFWGGLALTIAIQIFFAVKYLVETKMPPSSQSIVTPTSVELALVTATPETGSTLSAIPSPTPTRTLPPRRLIWSPDASVVYLRTKPVDGKVIRLLANGESVLVSEIQAKSGLDWAHVLYFNGEEDEEGWVAASYVVTIPADASLVMVVNPKGAYLRKEPSGTILAWLSDGTPLQLGQSQKTDKITWEYVTLPDGRTGWVAQHLLRP